MGKKEERPVKQCALCHRILELEESHIIPKFVYRYLKKTSGGGTRCIDNPNKLVQDSEKIYMLCGGCEDLFSIYETKFANKFFYPYQSYGVKEFQYDKDLYYFLTSVSWRSLYLDIIDFVTNYQEIGLDLDTLNCLISSENEMREYLLGKKNTVAGIENHLFFFEDIEKFNVQNADLLPHTTFHRSETSYTIFNSCKTSATITNMMGIVLFTLYHKNEKEEWINTEIINGNGIIKAKNQIIKSVCGNELISIMERVNNSLNYMSEKQKNKINDKILSDVNKFKNTKMYEDICKDYNLKE